MRASRSAGALIVGADLSSGRPASAGSASGARQSERASSQLDLHSLRKLEFGHTAPGGHGLTWEGTIVVKTAGQAQKLGVMPGWKIVMVDSHPTNTDEDIWMRLQEAKWQWRSTTVGFVTDFKKIRASQAKEKVRKINEEVDRLARLPFDGTEDVVHLEQVRAEFKFHGYIDKVEDRAINIRQLGRVLKWVEGHCHRWRDFQTRQRLMMSTMNMYYINDWLIKPATARKDCAFLELLTGQRQPPSWYVISWWGERVVDFMKGLELHMKTRELPENTGFWIGAYANRQHSMTDDILEDPCGTCYFRAMAAANFHALLTLEPRTEKVKDGVTQVMGPATAFSRIWCNMEAYLCCYDLPVGVDPCLDIVATNVAGKTMCITSGLTDAEQNIETVSPGQGFKLKMEREKTFTLDLIEAGLSIQIQSAQSSSATSKNRILNCLAGRDLSLQPLEKHDDYDKANCRLSALIATTCWRRVMAGTSGYNLQTKVSDALRGDVWDDTLELSMAFCMGVVERMPFVMRSLHQNLLFLTLDFKGMCLDDSVMKDLATSLPNGVEELHLDIAQNPEITNVGVANFIANIPSKMKALCLYVKGTGLTKEFQDVADSLEGIKQAIADEAARGSLCTTINLMPSPNRRMTYSSKKSHV